MGRSEWVGSTYPSIDSIKKETLAEHLLLVSLLLLLLVVGDVEELDLEAGLGGGHDTEPVTQLSTLQELLGQVLEVALREGDRGLDPDLALTLAGDLHGIAELAGLAIDLDAVVQELLESVRVKNAVVGRATEVNEEAVALGSSLRRTSADNLVRLGDSHFVTMQAAYCGSAKRKKRFGSLCRTAKMAPSIHT